MNAIITVVGTDKVGIIAKVSAFLAERGINIEDISQTVLSGNFVMMMMVSLGSCSKALEEIKKRTCGVRGYAERKHQPDARKSFFYYAQDLNEEENHEPAKQTHGEAVWIIYAAWRSTNKCR